MAKEFEMETNAARNESESGIWKKKFFSFCFFLLLFLFYVGLLDISKALLGQQSGTGV